MAEPREPVPPTKDAPTPSAIPQAHMVVPAENELPNESTFDARGGGMIETCTYETDETRPQELHGSVEYQKTTADPGKAPGFVAYTDLTRPRGTVRG